MSIPVVSRIGYVPALDGIRGILIIAVIGVHYFGYPIGADTSMDVFFALSGFLITTLLLEERDRKDRVSLPGFYRRRAYRLLPALFTVLGAYVIVTQVSPRGLEQTAAGGFYAANIVMASGSHLLDGTPMLVYWSLAQEEQFYLLWPLLLVLLLKRGVRESRIAMALVGLVIVLAIYRAMLAVGGATASRIYLRTGHARGRAYTRLRAGLCPPPRPSGSAVCRLAGARSIVRDLRICLAHPRPHRVWPLARCRSPRRCSSERQSNRASSPAASRSVRWHGSA